MISLPYGRAGIIEFGRQTGDFRIIGRTVRVQDEEKRLFPHVQILVIISLFPYARVIGVKPRVILYRHIFPNVLGPVFVLGTLHVATAILTEATLSFLGVGVPPTTPSLGTLIRIGSDFLFSGEWWITIFPGAALVALILSVNLVGDWLRDAFNPTLQQ